MSDEAIIDDRLYEIQQEEHDRIMVEREGEYMSKREPIKTITTTLDGRMERVNVCLVVEVRELEADYAKLEQKLLQTHKDYGCELRDPNGTIWEHAEKVEQQRDDLLQFVEWVLAETVRQRNGEGGDLRTIQHTAEALLARIKEGE